MTTTPRYDAVERKITFLKRRRDAISAQAMRTLDANRFKKLEKQVEELNEQVWKLESELA